MQLHAQKYNCGTTAWTDSVFVNGSHPLVYVLIDFKDGRKHVGSNYFEPSTDADLDSVSNINAVGSMGWNRSGSSFFKKAKKYSYEDYWDMIFSNNEYTGTKHPDYGSHQGIMDTVDHNTGYDLNVYGSIRDYWAEVSNNKWTITAFKTHGNGVGKVKTGIINNIDSSSGAHRIKWIMLNRNKGDIAKYGLSFGEVHDTLLNMFTRGEIGFNVDDTAFTNHQGKIGILYAGSAELGGYTHLNDTYYTHPEKTYDYPNTNSKVVFDGIGVGAHEYGHTIGIPHQVVGSYELMEWGGLGKRINYWCPPHINPKLKLERGWLTSSDTIRVSTNRTFSLPPITSSSPKVALVTIDGDAGAGGSWDHSEYYILEYRKREKFNRFTAGKNASFGSDSGGVLIWHYSSYGDFVFDGSDDVLTNLGLKVSNYGVSFKGDTGNVSHFYYSNHDSIGQTTTPNSNSINNGITGLKFSGFTVSSGNMNITASYTLGSVPVWNQFLTTDGQISNQVLSGNVFWHHKKTGATPDKIQYSNVTIAAGAHVYLPPNREMFLNGFNAIGTAGNRIKISGGEIGSTGKAKWGKIVLTNLGVGSITTDTAFIKYCDISDGTIGVEILEPDMKFEIENNNFSNNTKDIVFHGQSEGNYYFPKYSGNVGHLKLESGDWVVSNSQTVSIPSGGAITITGGIKLWMGTSANLYLYGNLFTNASPSNLVTFTSGTNAANSWGNITFDGNGADYSRLSNCKIERGGEVQCFNGADVFVDSSIFRKMNRAIYFSNSAPWILKNDIDSITLSGIEGNSNYEGVSVYNNTIKRGYTTKDYKGLYFISTNGNIIQNDVQGYTYGMYFKSSSSPLFNKGDGSNFNPNNKIKNNTTGIHARDESYPNVGDLDAVLGDNSIYSNSSHNIVAELGSYVMAENNYFGCGSPNNTYDGDSYISTESILIVDPFGEQSCGSNSVQMAEAITISSVISESNQNLKKQLKIGLKLRSEKNNALAFNHFKSMYLSNKLPKVALSQIVSLYCDTVDYGIYDFLQTQKLNTSENQKTILLQLAKLNNRRGDLVESKRLLSKVISEYPSSSEAQEAEFEQFYMALHRDKNKELASQYLDNLSSKYSESETAGPRYLFETAVFEVPESETNRSVLQRLPLQKQSTINVRKQELQFELTSNYPNPFNPSTTISYTIPEPSVVILTIYDNLGRKVTDLVNSFKPEGKYEIVFDAAKYASGIYYYKIVSGKYSAIKKMILMK